MTLVRLKDVSVERLIERFLKLAIREAEAPIPPAYDRAYFSIEDVVSELARREGDQRRALLPLYMHPDIRIRYRAAEATQAIEPMLSLSRRHAIDDEDWRPEWAKGALFKRAHRPSWRG